MSNACLTINFQTKSVSINGKAITLHGLQQGDFSAQYNDQKQEWLIRLNFKLYGYYGNEIFVRNYSNSLAFSIIIGTNEGHLVDSNIVKKLQNKYKLNLEIHHHSKISILDTAWSSAVFEYDIHYGLVCLSLIP